MEIIHWSQNQMVLLILPHKSTFSNALAFLRDTDSLINIYVLSLAMVERNDVFGKIDFIWRLRLVKVTAPQIRPSVGVENVSRVRLHEPVSSLFISVVTRLDP